MIPSPAVGNEHHFRLAVPVKILSGVLFVKYDVIARGAERHAPSAVVNRRRAVVSVAMVAARGTQRNLITVPKFLLVIPVLRLRQARGVARNLSQHVLREKRFGNTKGHNHTE